MPRSLSTQDRVVLLLSFVPYLLEHGATPVSELAAEFDVDEHLVRRLVSFLGVAGVPGETRTYQHEDLFDIDWEALELHDVVRLTQVVAVDDTPRFSSTESAALVAGLHALAPMLPEEMRAAAESTAQKLGALRPVEPTAVPVSVTPESPHSTAVLSSAMEHGRAVVFEYRDAQGRQTRRSVDPLYLHQVSGTWYLRAHCHARDAERTFLVDRMRGIEQTVSATHPPLTSRSHDSNPGALPTGGETVASLRVRLDAMHRIADFAPRSIGDAFAGWVEAEVDLLHPTVAVRLVQSAPGGVIVLGPESARRAVRQWAEESLAPYDE